MVKIVFTSNRPMDPMSARHLVARVWNPCFFFFVSETPPSKFSGEPGIFFLNKDPYNGLL